MCQRINWNINKSIYQNILSRIVWSKLSCVKGLIEILINLIYQNILSRIVGSKLSCVKGLIEILISLYIKIYWARIIA